MPYQNVLLIDDDVEDQEIFNSALIKISNNLKFNALTNAREALDKLNTSKLKPDVIFLDLNMPVMTGQEFLKQIKNINHLRSIPVIIFSTSSNTSTIAAAKELGAVDFITTPNRFNDLVEILKPLIQ